MRPGLGRLLWLALAWALTACAGQPETSSLQENDAEAPAESAAEQLRLVIDVREPKSFAEGHPPGALNLQLTWQQLPKRMPVYVPDRGLPLAIRAEDAEQWEAAAAILSELGYTDFQRVDPRDEARLELMSAAELRQRLSEPDPPVVLDVRTPEEWRGEVIAGAVRIEAASAPSVLPQLDPKLEYAVICEGGVRSSQLASLLRREGFPRVSNVIDGMWAWRQLED